MKIYMYIFDWLKISLEDIQIANVPRVHTILSKSLHKSNNSKIIMAAAGARPLPAVGVRKAALNRYLLSGEYQISLRPRAQDILHQAVLEKLEMSSLLSECFTFLPKSEKNCSIRGNPYRKQKFVHLRVEVFLQSSSHSLYCSRFTSYLSLFLVRFSIYL